MIAETNNGRSVAVLAESTVGVRWTAPADWKSEGPEPMRAATYTIAPALGDKTGAECGVYFFGAGQGGSLTANIERWEGQFSGPGGVPATAKVAMRVVHGLAITTGLELSASNVNDQTSHR